MLGSNYIVNQIIENYPDNNDNYICLANPSEVIFSNKSIMLKNFMGSGIDQLVSSIKVNTITKNKGLKYFNYISYVNVTPCRGSEFITDGKNKYMLNAASDFPYDPILKIEWDKGLIYRGFDESRCLIHKVIPENSKTVDYAVKVKASYLKYGDYLFKLDNLLYMMYLYEYQILTSDVDIYELNKGEVKLLASMDLKYLDNFMSGEFEIYVSGMYRHTSDSFDLGIYIYESTRDIREHMFNFCHATLVRDKLFIVSSYGLGLMCAILPNVNNPYDQFYLFAIYYDEFIKHVRVLSSDGKAHICFEGSNGLNGLCVEVDKIKSFDSLSNINIFNKNGIIYPEDPKEVCDYLFNGDFKIGEILCDDGVAYYYSIFDLPLSITNDDDNYLLSIPLLPVSIHGATTTYLYSKRQYI